jgi:hypothetical protein
MLGPNMMRLIGSLAGLGTLPNTDSQNINIVNCSVSQCDDE